MPLQTCTFERTLLPAQALTPQVQYVSPGQIFDQTAGGMFFVIQTTGRTAGTLTVALQGSGDGTNWYALDADLSVVVSANGSRYILTRRGLPLYMRLRLTPAGGFDGTVGVVARSSGLIGNPRSTSIQLS